MITNPEDRFSHDEAQIKRAFFFFLSQMMRTNRFVITLFYEKIWEVIPNLSSDAHLNFLA